MKTTWNRDEIIENLNAAGYDDADIDEVVAAAWERAWREENGVCNLDLDIIEAESDAEGLAERFESEIVKVKELVDALFSRMMS